MIYTFNLENKVILITGGYGYLGKAITESLLFHGAIVYVLGKGESKFQQVFDDGFRERNRIFFQPCDVSNTHSIVNAFKTIYGKTKKINVLINNAVYTKGKFPERITDLEWKVGIDGVLGNIYRCIKEIIPFFKKNNGGKIINVASMYGIISPDFKVYDNHPEFINPPHTGAAKAGVIQLTKYYAAYLGKHGVNVNAVSPGPFPSKDVQKSKDFIDELRKRTCLDRIGFPEDVAGAFIFLSSDSSNFVTGQNLVIDGGWTTK